MSKELIKLESPELARINESRAEQIKSTFDPMVAMLSDFESAFNEIISEAKTEVNQELIDKAKRLRIDISKIRIDTGKLKDKQKEYIKLEDKAIMGVHNILVYAVKEKEDKLREIEKFFENQERERLEALQKERAEKLSEYVDDAHDRDLAKFEDDEFEALYLLKRNQYNDRIAAEQKAEADRIAKEKAEAEERERIKQENEILRKEAQARAERERIEAEKRAKIEAERKAKEEAERKAREDKERKERAEMQAKIDAERKAKEEAERKARAERERLEAELKDKEEAERKAKEEAEARLQAELSKGDSDKVKDLITDLEGLKSKYKFKSNKNQKMYGDVQSLIDKVINHINK